MMVVSLTMDKAGRLHSMFFLLVFLGYLADVVLFHYKINALELIGAIIIITGSILIFVMKVFNCAQ